MKNQLDSFLLTDCVNIVCLMNESLLCAVLHTKLLDVCSGEIEGGRRSTNYSILRSTSLKPHERDMSFIGIM